MKRAALGLYKQINLTTVFLLVRCMLFPLLSVAPVSILRLTLTSLAFLLRHELVSDEIRLGCYL